VRAFYRLARDPRHFWLTVYPSTNGVAFAGEHRLHTGQEDELEMLGPSDTARPVVRLGGAGQADCTALLDTSAAESWMEFVTAGSMGAVPLGYPAYETQAVHVPDTARGFLCVVDTLRLGQVHIETGLVFARSTGGGLGPLARGLAEPPPRCVLGMRLLRALSYVRFDFPQGKVSVAATSPYTPREEVLLASVPMREARGALAVEGNVNGRPATVVLDTGGSYCVAAEADCEQGSLRHLAMGEVVVRHTPCGAPDELGVDLGRYPHAGLGVLRKFVVVLDNRRGVVHFERPSS
jgi:hypothetical protein